MYGLNPVLRLLVVIALHAGAFSIIRGQVPTTIRSGRSFDVWSALPASYRAQNLHVRAFVARPSGLYFLVLGGQSLETAQALILHTGHDGSTRNVFPVVPGLLLAMDVDQSGRIYVLRVTSPPTRGVQVFDEKGNQLRQIPADVPRIKAMSVVGDAVLVATDEGGVYQLTEQATKVATIPGPLRVARLSSLPDARFVLVKGIEGWIHFGTVKPGPTALVADLGVDIDFGRKWYATKHPPDKYSPGKKGTQVRGVVIRGLATAADGRVYLSLSPMRPAEGARIAELDGQGKLQRGFRCLLPRAVRRVDGSYDPILPNHIGVANRQLFLADSAGTVAVFEL